MLYLYLLSLGEETEAAVAYVILRLLILLLVVSGEV
jgi:hypothetical protein